MNFKKYEDCSQLEPQILHKVPAGNHYIILKQKTTKSNKPSTYCRTDWCSDKLYYERSCLRQIQENVQNCWMLAEIETDTEKHLSLECYFGKTRKNSISNQALPSKVLRKSSNFRRKISTEREDCSSLTVAAPKKLWQQVCRKC